MNKPTTKSLNKPILGVFITHSDGDHIGGLEAFVDYKIYSQSGVLSDIKKKYPDIIFTAETLGCSEEQSKQTAQAGFDYIFNIFLQYFSYY